MSFGRANFACDYGLAAQGAVFGPGLAAVGAVVGLIGTAVSAMGTIAAGQAQSAAADYQAQQLERKAAEERAASQREAFTKKQEVDLVQSRIQAGAAASGLGTLDPTIQDLAGDTEVQGQMNQKMVRYGGEQRRAGLLDQASAARATGKAEEQGSIFGAVGTMIGGASSFFTKYGEATAKPTSGPSLWDTRPTASSGAYG